MHNCLVDPFITVEREGSGRVSASLPQVLALLTDDQIASFPALRPHQRQAWHALLVQLAALAMLKAERTELPTDTAEWATRLRALTPDWPEDEPWSLVSPPEKPALLQAPVPGGDLSDFRKTIATPDALDMLITSKNHDLKAAVMADAQPEDWLFALVCEQTMDGGLSGSYRGISRMNSDTGNRAAVSIVPTAGFGQRFRRDVEILSRPEVPTTIAHEFSDWITEKDGLALLWLLPWDGRTAINPTKTKLHPYYIEICRRVRFVKNGEYLLVLKATNKSRINDKFLEEFNGRTGDPWAPVQNADQKTLSIDGSGFNYTRMTKLIVRKEYTPSLLQKIDQTDPEEGLALLGCSVARGNGKTAGYHERTVPVARRVIRLLRRGGGDILAQIAERRVEEVSSMRWKVLRRSLFVLLQDGADDDDVDYKSKTTEDQVKKWLDAFEHEVDQIFFERLWEEVAADGGDRDSIRLTWLRELRDLARRQLAKAEGATPHATMRRYKALTRSRNMFDRQVYKQFPDLRPKESDDAAA